MKQVYKFPIYMEKDIFFIKLPLEAEILSFQVQKNEPVLWVLCNSNTDFKEERYFRIAGTGHIIKENIKKFIGTIQLNDGRFIFHLFELNSL